MKNATERRLLCVLRNHRGQLRHSLYECIDFLSGLYAGIRKALGDTTGQVCVGRNPSIHSWHNGRKAGFFTFSQRGALVSSKYCGHADSLLSPRCSVLLRLG